MYKLSNNSNYIIRIEDNALIPAEPANADYQAFLAWKKSGGLPTAVEQPSAANLWEVYKQQAQSLIDKSDVTLIRCVENGVAVPATWADYRKALRAIISASTGDTTKPLPTRPSFPAGT